MVILAMIGGGLFAIPYRLSLETIEPLTVVWGVFIWALFFSLPGALIVRKRIRYSLRVVWVTFATSFAGLIGNFSVCQALEQESATLFNLISRSEIIIAMILSSIFLKEIIYNRVWISVLFILLGIFVMKFDSLYFQLNEWSAFLWAILTAFSFAVMLVLAKSIIHEIDPQILNVFRLILSLIILWSFEEVRTGIKDLKIFEWKLLALSAFCGPFLGRLAYTYSLKYLTVSKAVIICSFSPVITLVFELFIFGTIISWLEAFGGFIMLGGIIWTFLPVTRTKEFLD